MTNAPDRFETEDGAAALEWLRARGLSCGPDGWRDKHGRTAAILSHDGRLWHVMLWTVQA